jgi:hypothetical protein
MNSVISVVPVMGELKKVRMKTSATVRSIINPRTPVATYANHLLR